MGVDPNALSPAECRVRFGSGRVARLGTADARGTPHVVPVVFVLDGNTVYSAVDRKPKRTTALRRLANVVANPAASLLVDHYDDADWDALWWVRADGRARVTDGVADREEVGHALDLLTSRYSQYRAQPPPGPVLAVDVDRWSGWSGRATTSGTP